MRVAVCLSGHMRTYKDTFASLEDNLMRGHECDVFVHTWYDVGYREEWKEPALGEIDVGHVVKTYQPSSLVVEDRASLKDLSPAYSMFRKVKLCDALRQEHQRLSGVVYDVVVRVRPDVFIEKPVDLTLVRSPGHLYVPNCADYGGLNDQLALAGPAEMTKYSDFPIERRAPAQSFNPEKDLSTHISGCGLHIDRIDIQYYILRTNGYKFQNR